MSQKLTILVADDELLERKAIIELIRLCYDPVEIIEANNGRSAVEAAARHSLDVAFMDIDMPVMNGLDALCEMYRIKPELYAVMLTAYDEFEFAVQALKLGVQDYLLKPARKEKIGNCISDYLKRVQNMSASMHSSKEIKSMESLFPYLEDNLLFSIVMGNLDDTYKLLQYFLPASSRYVLAVGQCLDGEDVSKNVLQELKSKALASVGITLVAGDLGRKWLVLCAFEGPKEDFPKWKTQSFAEILPSVIHWQVSSLIDDWKQLNTQYRLLTDSSTVYPQKEGHADRALEGCEKMIAMQIMAADEEGALETVSTVIDAMQHEELEPRRQRLWSLCIIIDHYLEKTIDRSSFGETPDYSLIQTEDALGAAVRFFVQTRIEMCHQEQQPRIRRLVRDAVDDIEHHYSDGMYSLDAAAHNLKLSPGYLSRLFKTRMGVTFTEYLSEVRIDEAKRLLKRTDMEIADISMRCGFNSANYFCKIFKRIVGVPASDYR